MDFSDPADADLFGARVRTEGTVVDTTVQPIDTSPTDANSVQLAPTTGSERWGVLDDVFPGAGSEVRIFSSK